MVRVPRKEAWEEVVRGGGEARRRVGWVEGEGEGEGGGKR